MAGCGAVDLVVDDGGCEVTAHLRVILQNVRREYHLRIPDAEIDAAVDRAWCQLDVRGLHADDDVDLCIVVDPGPPTQGPSFDVAGPLPDDVDAEIVRRFRSGFRAALGWTA